MDAREGEKLVGVAHANDRMEAEMIQGLLEGAGIPSVLQPTGIDGPAVGVGWLNPGGGSRRVMVHAVESERAQAVLAEALVAGEQIEWTEVASSSQFEETGRAEPRSYSLVGAYARIWAWSLGAMALAFVVFLLLR